MFGPEAAAGETFVAKFGGAVYALEKEKTEIISFNDLDEIVFGGE